MISARIEGETFAGLGKEVLDELQPRGEAAVNRALEVVHAKVLDLLSRPGRGGSLGSEPGTPPLLRRGTLRRSIKIRRARVVENVISGNIYSKHLAAGAHEYGGRVGRKKQVLLSARPYMRPALEQTEPEVNAILEAL